MAKDPRPRRVGSSPYSRTGLFPWGNTYDVPAQRDDRGYSSQTPCHLRTVRLTGNDPAHVRSVRCPACGRAWTVRVHTERGTAIATWTA